MRCVGADAASCVSQSRFPVGALRGNVNEQIATALLRLQRDMANVLHRLQALEMIAVSQVKVHGFGPVINTDGDRDIILSSSQQLLIFF